MTSSETEADGVAARTRSGLVKDSGEEAKPHALDSTFQGAHRMDAADWCPAHVHPASPEGQDILFEVLRQRGIRIPAVPDLGRNKDPPVLMWTRRSWRHDGDPYWAWLPHCSGNPPGSRRRRPPVVTGADAGDVASSFCVALSLLARLICSSFSCVNATRVAGNLHWCVGRGFGRERHCGFGCEHPV